VRFCVELKIGHCNFEMQDVFLASCLCVHLEIYGFITYTYTYVRDAPTWSVDWDEFASVK